MKNLKNPAGTDVGFDLDREIALCVQYLHEKRDREQWLGQSFYDFNGLLAKLDSAERELASAVSHLQELNRHFALGCMEPFSNQARRIEHSYQSAEDALMEIRITKNEVRIEHPQKTRELTLQKSAARLAYGIVGDRVRGQARKVANQIMLKADIGEADPSTLTGWLKEFRAEDGNVR